MTSPVFVIHGVSNRDPNAFTRQVERLRDDGGGRWDMRAVYWGDLGADDRWIHLTIPSVGALEYRTVAGSSELRDGDEALVGQSAGPVDPVAAALLAPLRPLATAEVRDATEARQLDIVAAGAARRLATTPGAGAEVREAGAVPLRSAIDEHWASTRWLQHVTDPALLDEIGAAIAAPLVDPDLTVTPAGGQEIRGEELRGIDFGGFVERRIAEIDRLVGATIGSAAGRLNSYLRTEQGPGVTRFLGDVLVYQRYRAEIHQRVRDVISEVDPALGRDPEHPVRLIGHSLGGVIAVDMATADDPLWTRSLVTFGSQSPFFHVCDPRGGQLRPYADGSFVQLPASLGAWTNLWEPMDMLAFIAGNVFRMNDGTAPIDLPIDHLVSSGLWTHSVYWDLDEVKLAINKALERFG
jgi:hypothetical protein